MKNKKFWKYFKEYEWSNVFAMLKNNRKEPQLCNEDCKGKWVMITGATSGIGNYTAKKYASMGAHLLCINRNPEKSAALAQEIEQDYKVKCKYIITDLSSLKQTHQLAQQLLEINHPIDIIIHNAGVHLTQKEITDEGIEKVFMVHYLSSFILNYRLKEKLMKQDKARIIVVNSEGHRFAVWGLRLDDLNWEKRRYSGLKSYGAAKLAQLQSILIFKEVFQNSNVTINAMHPGAVKSETGQDNGKLYQWYKRNVLEKALKPTSIAAEALYYLGNAKEVESINGKFFNLTTLEEPTPPALDYDSAQQLWDYSLKIGKLK